MEQKIEQHITRENIIKIVNRNELSITGVQKVIGFSETQINLVALNCNLTILGEQMHTQKLDVEDGNLQVVGLIKLLKWEDKKEKVGFFKRIFK